jgi:hypothetical protein
MTDKGIQTIIDRFNKNTERFLASPSISGNEFKQGMFLCYKNALPGIYPDRYTSLCSAQPRKFFGDK